MIYEGYRKKKTTQIKRRQSAQLVSQYIIKSDFITTMGRGRDVLSWQNDINLGHNNALKRMYENSLLLKFKFKIMENGEWRCSIFSISFTFYSIVWRFLKFVENCVVSNTCRCFYIARKYMIRSQYINSPYENLNWNVGVPDFSWYWP